MDDLVVIGGEISLVYDGIDGGQSITIALDGSPGMFQPLYPEAYGGETDVTPSTETQVLPCEGLMMAHNVTINPIPSNYGLITWDGSAITVS